VSGDSARRRQESEEVRSCRTGVDLGAQRERVGGERRAAIEWGIFRARIREHRGREAAARGVVDAATELHCFRDLVRASSLLPSPTASSSKGGVEGDLGVKRW
jgi:hypothetical protein